MNSQQDSVVSPGLLWEISRLLDKKSQSYALFGTNAKDYMDEIMRFAGISKRVGIYSFSPKLEIGGNRVYYDFNQHTGLEKFDMALLIRCLEYVDDPLAFVAGLSKKIDKSMVLSYPGKEFYPNERGRKETGWKNHFTKDDIISLFTSRDFMVSYFEPNLRLKQLIFQFKTGRQNTVQDNYLCCGCSACVYRCPTDAIYEEQDRNGLFRAFVDYDKCTTCGKCSRACPVITFRPPKKNTETPKCYAFENDVSISMASTTTGGFQVLARHFISIGGKVAGASWVKDEYGNYTRVKHVLAQSLEELPRIYRSKYVQSEIGDTFKKIKEELDNGGKVLFSGVPCQVAGLYNAIGRGYENLYTAEILCYSTPSQKYFRRYLDEQFGPSNVKEYDFRAKSVDEKYGNHVRIILTSGEEIFMPNQQNIYSRLYFSRIISNDYCDNCRFVGYPRQADITLGDFAEIQKYDPQFTYGISELALLNNYKGEELFDIIKSSAVKFKEQDFSLASKYNGGSKPHRVNPMRGIFNAMVINGGGLVETAEAIFRQTDTISNLRSTLYTERNKQQIEIDAIRLYYRHRFLNLIIKTIVSRKMRKKLKKNPRKFFADSKHWFIKLLARYYN